MNDKQTFKIVLCFVLAECIPFCTLALADVPPGLYWAEYERMAGDVGKFRRANLDGSAPTDLFPTDSPLYLAIDARDEKIYWTNAGESTRVWRAKLDGTMKEAFTDVGGPGNGIQIDEQTRYVYWIDRTRRLILRKFIDDINAPVEEITIPLEVDSSLHDLALDLVNERMYWTDGNVGIYRSHLDGTEPDLIITAPTVGDGPIALALDVAKNLMFWTDSGGDVLKKADLLGNDVMEIVPLGLLNEARGIAVDLVAERLYVADTNDYEFHLFDYNGNEIPLDPSLIVANPLGTRVVVPEPSSALGLLVLFGATAVTRRHHLPVKPIATASAG